MRRASRETHAARTTLTCSRNGQGMGRSRCSTVGRRSRPQPSRGSYSSTLPKRISFALSLPGPRVASVHARPPSRGRFYCTDFDRNLTATGRPSLSLPVPLRELEPDKSAVLSPPVPPCPPVSLKENDYESEGRRFESCRARP